MICIFDSPPAGSMVVFDKAYNYYLQFAKWTAMGVNFGCRLKENAKYEVPREPLFEKKLGKDEFSCRCFEEGGR